MSEAPHAAAWRAAQDSKGRFVGSWNKGNEPIKLDQWAVQTLQSVKDRAMMVKPSPDKSWSTVLKQAKDFFDSADANPKPNTPVANLTKELIKEYKLGTDLQTFNRVLDLGRAFVEQAGNPGADEAKFRREFSPTGTEDDVAVRAAGMRLGVMAFYEATEGLKEKNGTYTAEEMRAKFDKILF
jgi:hypothetical protein